MSEGKIIIVTHRKMDADALISALFMEAVLKRDFPNKEIIFEFIPGDQTLGGMEVHPDHMCETLGNNHVYHVDCGRGLFDNHRKGSNEQSSAKIIDARFGKHFPDWKKLVNVADLDDQAKYGVDDQGKFLAPLGFPEMLLGLHAQYPDNDNKVLEAMRPLIEGALIREGMLREMRAVKTLFLDDFFTDDKPDLSQPCILKCRVGNLGLVVATDDDRMAALRNHLQRDCFVVVAHSQKSGFTDITVSRRANLDLGEIGVVAAIRQAEAAARPETIVPSLEELENAELVVGIPWFAHKPKDRVISLKNGSTKAALSTDSLSRLSVWVVLAIVQQKMRESRIATPEVPFDDHVMKANLGVIDEDKKHMRLSQE